MEGREEKYASFGRHARPAQGTVVAAGRAPNMRANAFPAAFPARIVEKDPPPCSFT